MKIDVIGSSAKAKYVNLNAQRTINWYLTVGTQHESDKSQKALYPTPGNTLFASVNSRYHRGAFVAQGINISERCFFVTDKTLYELKADSTIITISVLDNLPFGYSRVYFALNDNNQMFVGHDNAGYTVDLTTQSTVATPITDPNYPGCKSSDFMDGYLFVVRNGRVYYNDVLNDYTQWNESSDVLTAAYKSDSVVAVRCLKEEVYIWGEHSIAVYLNDAVSPFSRRQGSTLLYGLAARNTLATYNDGHFFIGQSTDGQYAVYFLGYDYSSGIQQISDFNRTWALNNKVKAIGNAYAWIQHTKDGHIFYNLTIPELNTTWVYDAQSLEWIERQSKRPVNDSDGEPIYKENHVRFGINFKGMNLLFDKYSGNILIEDYKSMTENDQTIKRQRTSQNYDQDRQYISVSDLEFDINRGEAATISGQGSNPILIVELSKDGGHTFGTPREVYLGALGKYIKRVRLTKLGTARDWVIRVTLTDPVDLMIQSAQANGMVSGAAQSNQPGQPQ